MSLLKSIQVGRGIASLLVVLFHLGHFIADPNYLGAAIFARPFIWGDAGVSYFFVLSGFLIPWIHFNDINRPEKLAAYIRRRVVRLYPVYWIIFAVAAGAAVVMPQHLTILLPLDALSYVKGLLLLPQDPAVLHGTAPVLVQAWTMNYEMCFYALVALFILNGWLGALAVAALCANLVSCHVTACTFPRSFFAGQLFLHFAMGAAVALLMRRAVRLPLARGVRSVAGLLLAALCVTETVLGHHIAMSVRPLGYAALSAVLIWSLVQEEMNATPPTARALVALGDASYMLYLVHLPLIEILCQVAVRLGLQRDGIVGASITYVLILLACVCAALLLHRWLERPLLRCLSGRQRAADSQRDSIQVAR